MQSELAEDLRTVKRIQDLLAPNDISDLDREQIKELIFGLVEDVEALSTDRGIAEVFGLVALHPNAFVRHYMLGIATVHITNVFCRKFIISLTHDDEDFVAFEAIRLCGEYRLQDSVDDLVPIVGWPSKGVHQGGKPVGVGRATGLKAMVAIFGTEDSDELASIEDYYQKHDHFPPEMLSNPGLAYRESGSVEPGYQQSNPPDGMVYVPSGTYTIGAEDGELPTNRFATDDIIEPFEVEIPPFYIDKYPVTNAEYDEFVEYVEQHGHEFCHPSEPEEKDHRRNTWDEDLGPDHPVVGINYYDAYAYAKWAGKDLPFEEEWEAAARGKTGSIFPWGDEWKPDRLNWAANSLDTEIGDIDHWTDLLAKDGVDTTETRTVPVDTFENGQSEFGVVDMLGNAWEYTKSNYFTRQEMHPLFNHSPTTSHENIVDDREAFPVIRGGAWSSIPEMTTAVFRGKDLLTDRHNEIGFRCVKRV